MAPENNTPRQMIKEFAKRWMTARCESGLQCPLDHPSAPVRRLADCYTFRKEVIKACPRTDEMDTVVAIAKDATCPHSQGQ